MKISDMQGVREHTERAIVELHRSNERLVVRAFNECGNNYTDVDLLDILDWVNNLSPSSVQELFKR